MHPTCSPTHLSDFVLRMRKHGESALLNGGEEMFIAA